MVKPITVTLCLLIFLVGCQSPVNRTALSAKSAATFDTSGYQRILNKYVSEGKIRYANLKNDREDLDAFLRDIAHFGPQSAPNYFSSDKQKISFWINVYNAAGLVYALNYYPAKSVVPLLDNLEDIITVIADGKIYSLREIRIKVMELLSDDPRSGTLLILPAKGSGEFPKNMITAENLDSEMSLAFKRALSDKTIFKIDHEHKALQLPRCIYGQRKNYLSYYQRKFHLKEMTLINALCMFADASDRRRLNTSLGYRIEEFPFDNSLNEVDEPPCSLDTL
jgi:hypothetical protein